MYAFLTVLCYHSELAQRVLSFLKQTMFLDVFSTEYCHTDADDGFLVILSGQKQARLFGCEVEPLYPNPKGTKGRTLQSQVDCDNPDLTKHPLFSTVTCHHCLLNQGDM